MGKTSIEWTRGIDGTEGFSWNPVSGCSRASTGCENCYAERIAARFSPAGFRFDGVAEMRDGWPRWTGKVELDLTKLEDPFRWRKAKRVFVNSMSDLFHEKLSVDEIAAVWTVMQLAPLHTYMVLTKRAERMRDVLSEVAFYDAILENAAEIRRGRPELHSIGVSNPSRSPPRHIWGGVSVENQGYADERISKLVETPLGVRFVSAEPLLGPLDLTQWLYPVPFAHTDHIRIPAIDWVIVGAESGPNARPMSEDWVRAIRDQCVAAGVPFFYKQNATAGGRKLPLPELDGRQWMEMPE